MRLVVINEGVCRTRLDISLKPPLSPGFEPWGFVRNVLKINRTPLLLLRRLQKIELRHHGVYSFVAFLNWSGEILHKRLTLPSSQKTVRKRYQKTMHMTSKCTKMSEPVIAALQEVNVNIFILCN